MFFAMLLLHSFFLVTVEASFVNKFDFKTDTFNFANDDRIMFRPLSFEDAYGELKSVEWTASFPDWAVRLLAGVVVVMHKNSGGNCWGMSYTAKYYYENPDLFEAKYPEYSNLHEVPRDLIANEIISNQYLSIFADQTVLYNCILFLAEFPIIEEQITHIQSQLDNNSPELLMFDTHYSDGRNGSHAVLAYDYWINNKDNGQYSEFLLSIYDPNTPSKSQWLNFSTSQMGQYSLAESDLTKIYNPSNLNCATFAEPDWDFILENRGQLIEGILDELGYTLPIDEILMVAILIILILVALFICALIVLVYTIKKQNRKSFNYQLQTSNKSVVA